jgi:hypothetical protein
LGYGQHPMIKMTCGAYLKKNPKEMEVPEKHNTKKRL